VAGGEGPLGIVVELLGKPPDDLDVGEFLVAANIPKLRASAERALGTDLRLAGRRIIA